MPDNAPGLGAAIPRAEVAPPVAAVAKEAEPIDDDEDVDDEDEESDVEAEADEDE
jgi:hypothetical protein